MILNGSLYLPALGRMVLTQYQKEIVLFDRQVPLLVAIVVGAAITGLVGSGMVLKIKTRFFQTRGRYFDFTTWIKGIKYSSVFLQDIIYSPDIFTGHTMLPVIVGAAALVRAEFLVNSAKYRGAAF